jgi:hypothetical protein
MHDLTLAWQMHDLTHDLTLAWHQVSSELESLRSDLLQMSDRYQNLEDVSDAANSFL